jgi:hypothetical protein
MWLLWWMSEHQFNENPTSGLGLLGFEDQSRLPASLNGALVGEHPWQGHATARDSGRGSCGKPGGAQLQAIALGSVSVAKAQVRYLQAIRLVYGYLLPQARGGAMGCAYRDGAIIDTV